MAKQQCHNQEQDQEHLSSDSGMGEEGTGPASKWRDAQGEQVPEAPVAYHGWGARFRVTLTKPCLLITGLAFVWMCCNWSL